MYAIDRVEALPIGDMLAVIAASSPPDRCSYANEKLGQVDAEVLLERDILCPLTTERWRENLLR